MRIQREDRRRLLRRRQRARRYDDQPFDPGRNPDPHGVPSLAMVCCADPALLHEYVDGIYGYIRRRLVDPVADGLAQLAGTPG